MSGLRGVVDRVRRVEVLTDRPDDEVTPPHRVDRSLTIGREFGVVDEQRGELVPPVQIDALAVAGFEPFDLVECDQCVEVHAHAPDAALLQRGRGR